jgi:hypothetical protein
MQLSGPPEGRKRGPRDSRAVAVPGKGKERGKEKVHPQPPTRRGEVYPMAREPTLEEKAQTPSRVSRGICHNTRVEVSRSARAKPGETVTAREHLRTAGRIGLHRTVQGIHSDQDLLLLGIKCVYALLSRTKVRAQKRTANGTTSSQGNSVKESRHDQQLPFRR